MQAFAKAETAGSVLPPLLRKSVLACSPWMRIQAAPMPAGDGAVYGFSWRRTPGQTKNFILDCWNVGGTPPCWSRTRKPWRRGGKRV